MTTAPDMLAAGLKMIVALGLVLGIMLALSYGLRRITGRRMGGVGGKRIQVLESHYLGVKKTISLVRVPGKVLVLGVTGDRINLLTTLDEETVGQPTADDESSSFGLMLTQGLKKLGSGPKGGKGR